MGVFTLHVLLCSTIQRGWFIDAYLMDQASLLEIHVYCIWLAIYESTDVAYIPVSIPIPVL